MKARLLGILRDLVVMAGLTAIMFLVLMREIPHLPWEPRATPSSAPLGVPVPPERSVLRIGVGERPSSLPMYTLKEEHELKVEIVVVPDEAERWAQLAAGRLDLAVGTMPSYALALTRLRAGNFLCSVGNDVGEDALVGKPEVKQISELKDHSIAVPEGGTGEFLLAAFLDTANLSMSQTKIVTTATDSDAADLLKRGQVDAAVLWLPALAERPAGSTVLAAVTEGKEPRLEEMCAVRRNLPPLLQSRIAPLMRDYFQFIDDMKERHSVARDKVVRNTGLSSGTLADYFKSVQFATLADNRSLDAPTVARELGDLQHVLNLIGAPNATQLSNLEDYVTLDWLSAESPANP